jgi:DNA polymerase III subunit epsilon
VYGLFFDTETTGIAKWSAPSVSPEQPNLVQLGALLVDLETREDVASLDLIVTPNGQWTIPDGAAAVHKITTEKAEKCGVLLESAVLPFRDMLAAADLLIAHNIKFDKIIMERASAMVDLSFGQEVQDLWLPTNKFVCTMLKSTGIVKKQSKRAMHKQDYGWPKLFEALKHFTGEDLPGAHNAMVDVIACKKIFFKLLDETDALDDIFYTKETA